MTADAEERLRAGATEAALRDDQTAPKIERVEASVFRVPTDAPESDGTFAWDATVVVVAEVDAGGCRGTGFSYTHEAAAVLLRDTLAKAVVGRVAFDTDAAWAAMAHAVRNVGRSGVASSAISAVDVALWDLKARLLGQSLVRLLGRVREAIPAYGSGGFTSYTDARLREQLGGWVRQGMRRVKMKVGREPERDIARVRVARDAIGPDAALYVDANGAYAEKQALALAIPFRELGVTWFEEPVPFDDLEGLRFVRERVPAGMEVAAGEYGYVIRDFRRMLEAGSVDVMQADATRCGGFTGFLRVGALCAAWSLALSAHTAPSLHAHVCCAIEPARNVEYFHDHVRIEHLLFEGALTVREGVLHPDPDVPGMGLTLRRADAERYAV